MVVLSYLKYHRLRLHTLWFTLHVPFTVRSFEFIYFYLHVFDCCFLICCFLLVVIIVIKEGFTRKDAYVFTASD